MVYCNLTDPTKIPLQQYNKKSRDLLFNTIFKATIYIKVSFVTDIWMEQSTLPEYLPTSFIGMAT